MTITQPSRSRQPKGLSTGGQYAPEHRPEAGATLTAQSATKRSTRSRSDLLKTLPELDFTRLDRSDHQSVWMEAAQQAAAFWNERYGVERRSNINTADDVVQETMAAVWKDFEAYRSGDAKKAPDYPRQYLVSVAANYSVRATADGKRFDAENRRAMRDLKARLERIEKTHGRTATRAEYDQAKADVLVEWHDPLRKPNSDFDVTRERAVSLDRPLTGEEGSATLGSLLAGRTAVKNDVPAASLMDHVSQDMESRGVKAVDRRMRQAWNAYAEYVDAPSTQAGSLTDVQIAAHSQAINDHPGGVRQAITDWRMGEDNAAVDALTSPFGDLSMRDQERVVDALDRFTAGRDQGSAGSMFASVLASAGSEGVKDREHYARETAKVLAGEDSATRRARKAAGME